jgi:ketosteroid isomerase-like protein
MAERLSTRDLAALINQGGPFSAGSSLSGDEMIGSVTEVLRRYAHPEFVTVMVSEPVTQDYEGVAGFEEAWSDWMTPYESFRVELDEVIPLEDRLVFLVRQMATTRHSAVAVETPSASIWSLEDGQIQQVAFYLDRRAGMKAAGIDPDRPPGD